ncbi:TonB-dependent receptor, partial [bacterium]|nr:TonB-dependent receptor [bacterium]
MLSKIFGSVICVVIVICMVIPNGFAETNSFYDQYSRNKHVALSGLLFWDCFLRNIIDQSIQQRLPNSWSLDEMINLAAGIPVNMETHVHGAAINDNQYLIDGLDHTDVLFANGRLGLTPEVVDSVEIQTSALNAEYGRIMGGVFNAVTRSGGDDWHGRIRLDYVDTDWESDSDHPRYHAGGGYNYWKPTFVLDGPVIREKLWFLAAYSYYQLDLPVTMIGSYGADYFNSEYLSRVDAESTYHHPFLKLSYQPYNSHRFDISYYSENYCREYASGDYNNARESWLDQESGYTAFSLDWKWFFSKDTTFKIKAGYVINEFDIIPDNKSDDPRDASFYDTYHQQNYNNGSSWSEDDRERLQLKAEVDWNVEDLFGKHRFKSGIEIQEHSYDFLNKYPGGSCYIITQIPAGDPNSPDYYYGDDASRESLLNPGIATLSADYLGIFIQDNWLVTDRIKLNLGIRYEWMEFQEDSGNTDVPAWSWGNFRADSWLNSDGSPKETAPMRFDDMLAPRLRISWDVFGNESTIVNGFYGRYYNPFDLSLPMMFQTFSAD